jgi:CubicO group peptidase (beta-lactamase class C family)/peptidoglycan/LPS O-acetylase OafA/YrhL
VIALVRVVLWHALAATWMTFFAAIPIMFFVAGSLLDGSRSRQPYGRVVLKRARRLLLPLWAYGVVIATASVVQSERMGQPVRLTSRGLAHAATWVVPLVDPKGSAWQGGWLSGHLWYLRAYFWMVLLAPLLALAARRLVLALPLLGAAIAALEVAGRHRLPFIGIGTTRVLVGDVITYGLFAILGMAYARRRRRRIRPLLPAIGALVCAAACAAYIAAFGLRGGDVNQSYPAIALVGMAWLLLAGALEAPIRRLAERRKVADTGLVISGRAETIYLWHPAAIVVAYAVTHHGPPAAIVAITVVLTAVATVAVGWVEDLAAGGRRLHARWKPMRAARFPALIPPAAMALAIATPFLAAPAGAAEGGAAAVTVSTVRPPSYREALSDAAFAPTTATTETATTPTTATALTPVAVAPPDPASPPTPTPTTSTATTAGPTARPADALQAALDRWAGAHPDVKGLAVAVADGKTAWAGQARRGASTVRASDQYDVASITKSFTIALVLQQVAAGTINLDIPIPALDGVAPVPDGVVITPRELLQHSSGLVDYSLADGFDQSKMLTPADAVSLSLHTKLLFAPGSNIHYANSGYLWLGLLLERVTGHSYHDLVAGLAGSVGLRHTEVSAPDIPGWTGFSSGGIRSTVADVARFERALFTPDRLVPGAMVTALTTLDVHNVGLGTWPICPCSTDAAGHRTYTLIGHYVANGGSYHYPDGMTMVIHVEPASTNSDALTVSLGQALRSAVNK